MGGARRIPQPKVENMAQSRKQISKSPAERRGALIRTTHSLSMAVQFPLMECPRGPRICDWSNPIGNRQSASDDRGAITRVIIRDGRLSESHIAGDNVSLVLGNGVGLVHIPSFALNSIVEMDLSLQDGEVALTFDMFRRDVRNSWISACPRLRHVKWPGRLSSIGDFCFMDTNISTVDLRGTRIRVLGVCAFCNCKGLTSLRVPETLESIGASCFARTELHSVNLRHCRNLREISIWAFKGCRS
jgi:hypothetical protein